MPGPPPKPTHLKVMAGNPGKRRINRAEPVVEGACPRAPATLTKEAKAEWRRLAPRLYRIGLLGPADRATFSAYCECWSQFLGATDDVKRHGLVVKTANGHLIQNPAVGIRNRAFEQLRQYAMHFGLSPSARSKMEVPLGGQAPKKPEAKGARRFLGSR